jgi:ribosomal protein L29
LDAHPILKARIVGLAGLVENAETIVLADQAERRVIEELRGMGNELLTAWAENRVAQAAREIEAPRVTKHVKKNSAGIVRTGKLK